MATTEHTINDALAAVLMETRSLWRQIGVVKSENIDVLKGSGKKPDILITEPNVSPVIVETEILPANSVESDAKQRLGEHLTPSARADIVVAGNQAAGQAEGLFRATVEGRNRQCV